jgi:hypothetical protein
LWLSEELPLTFSSSKTAHWLAAKWTSIMYRLIFYESAPNLSRCVLSQNYIFIHCIPDNKTSSSFICLLHYIKNRVWNYKQKLQ